MDPQSQKQNLNTFQPKPITDSTDGSSPPSPAQALGSQPSSLPKTPDPLQSPALKTEPPTFEAKSGIVSEKLSSETPTAKVQTTPEKPSSSLPPLAQAAPVAQPTPASSTTATKPDKHLSDVTSTPEVITSEKPKKSSKFGLLVIIFIIIAALIWAGVAYLYFQNKNLKDKNQSQVLSTPTSSLPSPTPTVFFSADQIKVVNGSIVNQLPNGASTTLVDKANYTSTGLAGFAKVAVSPDNAHICFESWPPSTEPALYLAKVDGTEISEVNPNRKNCLWSTDSQKIYYINYATTNTASDIYQYTLSTSEETNLTTDSVTQGVIRQFDVVSLSADGSKIVCTYQDLDPEASGNCEVDLEAGTVETTVSETETTPTATPSGTPAVS